MTPRWSFTCSVFPLGTVLGNRSAMQSAMVLVAQLASVSETVLWSVIAVPTWSEMATVTSVMGFVVIV